jgi:hypothetical protein
MALYCGLQLPIEHKLAGVLVMSGYLPGASAFNLTPGMEDVPVLHCHGTADPVVQLAWAEKTRDHLLAKGLQKYELRTYPGLQHSCSMKEIADAARFLGSILPFNADLAIPPKDPSTMSVKELKAAIRSAGLTSHAAGFAEKHEFVALLQNYYASLK